MNQIDVINKCLRNIYAIQNNNVIENSSTDNVEMKPVYLETEKFLFQIFLDEFYKPHSKNSFGNNNIITEFSPHEVLYGVLKGDKKFRDLLASLQYHSRGKINVQSISHMVTANIDKRIWYFRNELVYTNYKIKTFVELSISDMRTMLKSIPIPSICCRPSVYNVTDPKSFLQTVNDNEKALFDFIPFIKNHTLNDCIIKPNLVYRLASEITLIFT